MRIINTSHIHLLAYFSRTILGLWVAHQNVIYKRLYTSLIVEDYWIVSIGKKNRSDYPYRNENAKFVFPRLETFRVTFLIH